MIRVWQCSSGLVHCVDHYLVRSYWGNSVAVVHRRPVQSIIFFVLFFVHSPLCIKLRKAKSWKIVINCCISGLWGLSLSLSFSLFSFSFCWKCSMQQKIQKKMASHVMRVHYNNSSSFLSWLDSTFIVQPIDYSTDLPHNPYYYLLLNATSHLILQY